MPDAPPTKVSVTNVGKSPYEALLDFQRVVYSPTGDQDIRREDLTAHVTCKASLEAAVRTAADHI